MQLDLTRQEKIIDQGQEIPRPSGEPVEFHHDDVAHIAPFASRNQLREGWPVERLARDPVIGEHVAQSQFLSLTVGPDA